MRLLSFIAGLVVATSTAARTSAAEEHVFKIATLAPEGSTWWKVLVDTDKKLADKSGGRLRLKIYAGGVAGDEPDFVRKMRVGSLQGAGVTSVGLAEIQPALLALQAPSLIRSWDELDMARNKVGDRLQALLAEKGFVVLLWADVGFNRLFSQTKIERPEDLKKVKAWVWTEDGVYRTYYETAGVKAVPLALPDVLPSLQTGLIDAQCSPPLAALSLQWFTKAKYMLDFPIGAVIGAAVLTQKSLERLSPEDRALVTALGKEAGAAMRDAARRDNEQSVDALKKAGIQVVTPDASARAAWEELGKRAALNGAGPVYPKDLYEEIAKAVADYRATSGK
jgi:TRAP-type transport system periplasmic protein